MSLILTITDAGRQAIINAANTGTAPVIISHIALGSGRYNTNKTQTTLQNEIKRVTTFGGSAVADDVIHITIHDESNDTYSLGEFGLITNTGVLFAVYSQMGEFILEKNSNGILLLSADTKVTILDITAIEFAGTNFLLPPGTETTAGVLKLIDTDGALEGEDDTKAMTAKKTKAVISRHKQADDAHHWNQISNKPASYPPSAHGHPWSEISGKPDRYPAELHGHTWDEINNKPVNYTPSAHNHTWDEITGTLPNSKLPFNYSIDVYGEYLAQRDSNGDIKARRFKGSGVELHDLHAGSITQGVVDDARLPYVMSGKSFSGHTNINANLSVAREMSVNDVVRSPLFCPSLSGGVNNINSGLMWKSTDNYTYGVTVSSDAGGMEYHSNHGSNGRHRWYAGGEWNNPLLKMSLLSTGDLLLHSGAYHGDGSRLTAINYSQLPYTPIQQGGGIGQYNNKINLGLSAQSQLKATADGADLGDIAFQSWVANHFAAYRPQVTTVEAQTGTEYDIRQWSPQNINQAISALAGPNIFSVSKRKTLSVIPYDVLNGGTFHYYIVGNIALFFVDLNVDNATNEEEFATLPILDRPATETTVPIYSLYDMVNQRSYGVNIKISRNGTLSADIFMNGHHGGQNFSLSGSGMWRIQ